MNLETVYLELRAILQPFAGQLDGKADSDGKFYLDTHHIMPNKKPLFFGAVQIKKNYVSYHLMPVYVNPQLLDGLSPALKKRMQGKSCFNFRRIDLPLFEELAALTRAGFDDYRRQGYV